MPECVGDADRGVFPGYPSGMGRVLGGDAGGGGRVNGQWTDTAT